MLSEAKPRLCTTTITVQLSVNKLCILGGPYLQVVYGEQEHLQPQSAQALAGQRAVAVQQVRQPVR